MRGVKWRKKRIRLLLRLERGCGREMKLLFAFTDVAQQDEVYQCLGYVEEMLQDLLVIRRPTQSILKLTLRPDSTLS